MHPKKDDLGENVMKARREEFPHYDWSELDALVEKQMRGCMWEASGWWRVHYSYGTSDATVLTVRSSTPDTVTVCSPLTAETASRDLPQEEREGHMTSPDCGYEPTLCWGRGICQPGTHSQSPDSPQQPHLDQQGQK